VVFGRILYCFSGALRRVITNCKTVSKLVGKYQGQLGFSYSSGGA
jgi:hypothetical protein